MYKQPPEHTHGLQPDQIINRDEMELLKRHFIAWSGMKHGDDPESTVNSKFSKQDCARTAVLYEMLRDHGFWPDRIDQYGQVVWGILLKSQARMAFEKWCNEHPEAVNYKGSRQWAKRFPGEVEEAA